MMCARVFPLSRHQAVAEFQGERMSTDDLTAFFAAEVNASQVRVSSIYEWLPY